VNERPPPKLDPYEVRELLIEGLKLRADVEERFRKMRTPDARELAQQVR